MNTPPKLLDLIAEQSDETDAPQSLMEALGLLRVHIHQLQSELAKTEEEQDADILLQEFIAISGVAMSAAGSLVLPLIERGNS